MSKSKVYKKKSKLGSNIFVILAIVLAALIVVTIIATSVDNAKYNNLLKDYTEHEYGERQNIKLKRGQDPNTGIVSYANDKYAYYVDDNIIYDLTKNETVSQKFYDKASEIGAEMGTISSMIYQTYTDGSDFSKDYDYIEVAMTYDGVLGDKDVAAEKIWNFVSTLNEEYSVYGMYFSYTDNEAMYYTLISVIDKEPITLERIKENLATIELTGGVVVEEGSAEGEEAPAEGEETAK